MVREQLVSNDDDAIMQARYVADMVTRGAKMSLKNVHVLAAGFAVCDRKRAEYARALAIGKADT